MAESEDKDSSRIHPTEVSVFKFGPTADSSHMVKLMEMQKDLMSKVPHTVRPEVYAKMLQTRDLFHKVLLYLNSCGHKPWRPNPLPKDVQDKMFADAISSFRELARMWAAPTEVLVPELESRRLISAFGIIEEALEYLEAEERKTRADALEEITDGLFFYLEQLILGGYEWHEIEEQYVKKHAINLKRYEDGKKGNYEWDHREKGL
jgi:phosphoribosyl-ATP pyrophosphohydrolase